MARQINCTIFVLNYNNYRRSLLDGGGVEVRKWVLVINKGTTTPQGGGGDTAFFREKFARAPLRAHTHMPNGIWRQLWVDQKAHYPVVLFSTPGLVGGF